MASFKRIEIQSFSHSVFLWFSIHLFLEKVKVDQFKTITAEDEAKRSMEINNVAYVKIREEDCGKSESECSFHHESDPQIPTNPKPWNWRRMLNFCAILSCLSILTIVVIQWIGPFALTKIVVPAIKWVAEGLNHSELVILIFTSLAMFPTLCLPSTPSMWVAGMILSYRNGFLLVMAGVSVGVSLPYFLGSIFQSHIQVSLAKYPKQAAILRLAGEGNWFHQFQAITLIRISPFPYIIFNYAVVATNVHYSPYLLGTLVGMVPEVFIALYSGILMLTLAEATEDKKVLSLRQIAFDLVGFCASVVSTVFLGIYTKRRLDEQHDERVIPEIE